MHIEFKMALGCIDLNRVFGEKKTLYLHFMFFFICFKLLQWQWFNTVVIHLQWIYNFKIDLSIFFHGFARALTYVCL